MIRIAVNESEQRREPPFQSETPASITESRQNGNTFNYNEPIPPLGSEINNAKARVYRIPIVMKQRWKRKSRYLCMTDGGQPLA